MRKRWIAGMAAAGMLALATPAAALTGPSWNPTGRLILDEEFTGTAFNSALWAKGWFGNGITKPVNSSEQQGYSGANVTQPGTGQLNMALNTYGSLISTNPHDGVAGHKGYEFNPYGDSLGNKFGGKVAVEASIYMPGSNGRIWDWPAFWTDGQHWPTNGECDIVEGLSPGQTEFHVHTSTSNAGGTFNVGPGWHRYGMVWDGAAHRVDFYYDSRHAGSEPFAQGNAMQYLIFDYTSSTQHGGPIVKPSLMRVDWLHVWAMP